MAVEKVTEATPAVVDLRVVAAADWEEKAAGAVVAKANQEAHSNPANANQDRASPDFLCTSRRPETACT